MQAFHLLGLAPFYTNSFLLISEAGHAVVIDPAAEVQEYDRLLKEHDAQLTAIFCTHGHYDHVGSAGAPSAASTTPSSIARPWIAQGRAALPAAPRGRRRRL